MHRFITILFGILLLSGTAIIASIMPLGFVGNIMVQKMQKMEITLDNSSIWTFRLLGMKAATGDVRFDTTINDVKFEGSGENIVYSIISKKASMDRLSLDITVPYSKNFDDVIKEIFQKVSRNITYSFKAKRLILNIYINNEKGNKKLYDEIIINNFETTKTKKYVKYMADLNIDGERQMNLFFSIDRPNKPNFEINGKMNNGNLVCYVHNARYNSNFSCSINNLVRLMHDLGINLENDFFKHIFTKTLKVNGKIDNKSDGVAKVYGNINISGDSGKFEYNAIKHNLQINFDKLNLDNSITEDFDEDDDEKDNDIGLTKEEQAMLMSGKGGQILLRSFDEIYAKVNSLEKIANFMFSTTHSAELNSSININEIKLNDVNINNVKLFAVKKKNSYAFNAFEMSAMFGGNNALQIKNTPNQVGNFLVVGKDIGIIKQLLNSKYISPNLHSNNYIFRGDLQMSANGFRLKNLNGFVDKRNVLNYDNELAYDIVKKRTVKSERLKISGINIDNYFNMPEIYRAQYNSFFARQLSDKQDAVLWKWLFEKDNSESEGDDIKQRIFLNNVSYGGRLIEVFLVDNSEKKNSLRTEIVINSPAINGSLDFSVKNTSEDRYSIFGNLKATKIDLSDITHFELDYATATHSTLKQTFYDDHDYNIPSMLGINGKMDVDIKSLKTKNKIPIDNINGTLNMGDGMISTKNFKFNMKGGEVLTDGSLSLRGKPAFQAGISMSGLDLKQVLGNSLEGYLSIQGTISSYGFNPVKFIDELDGKGIVIIQNLKIPNFDLLNVSSNIIQNGIKEGKDYKKDIAKNSIIFPKVTGNLLLINGLLNGDATFSRELVSGSVEYEYKLFEGFLTKLSGSFASMMVRKKFEEPFVIYTPIACSGIITAPQCMAKWEQFDKVVEDAINLKKKEEEEEEDIA